MIPKFGLMSEDWEIVGLLTGMGKMLRESDFAVHVMNLALAGGFLTTTPLGKSSLCICF